MQHFYTFVRSEPDATIQAAAMRVLYVTRLARVRGVVDHEDHTTGSCPNGSTTSESSNEAETRISLLQDGSKSVEKAALRLSSLDWALRRQRRF